MNVCLEPIGPNDQVVEGLFPCDCWVALRLVQTDHARETCFGHALVIALCPWHRAVQRAFERWANRSLPLPVGVPDEHPLICRRDGCREQVVGLRRELALPHPYYPHERYVAVCGDHRGVPVEWVPLDLSGPEEPGLPP